MLGLAVLVVAGLATLLANATPGPASGPSAAHVTRTTVVATERPQRGWTVASTSARGVMVDYRNIVADGVSFRAVRLRTRTTLLRWHVGSSDPAHPATLPPDAGPAIDWSSEGRAGVVAVFNGGFKQAAHAGGSQVDGVDLVPMLAHRMTIAINAAGHWAMGLWDSPHFPPRGFKAVAYRQNLVPLVWNHRVTAAGVSSNWRQWGDPLGEVPPEPRSALGVDAQGNLIYVATMHPILAPTLGAALVQAGAVMGMELDINPYWPILGASFAPLHHPGTFPVQLPMAQHSPTIYETGWERDFFVALAEPNAWRCEWTSPGLRPSPSGAQAQPLHERCSARPPSTTTTTTTAPGPTTTSTAGP